MEDTYSAAVCELSDACDMLLVRGFLDMVVDWESAMIAITRNHLIRDGKQFDVEHKTKIRQNARY